jgi:hypothetical protein
MSSRLVSWQAFDVGWGVAMVLRFLSLLRLLSTFRSEIQNIRGWDHERLGILHLLPRLLVTRPSLTDGFPQGTVYTAAHAVEFLTLLLASNPGGEYHCLRSRCHQLRSDVSLRWAANSKTEHKCNSSPTLSLPRTALKSTANDAVTTTTRGKKSRFHVTTDPHFHAG